MTAIWTENEKGWTLLSASGFPAEAALHELVARNPQLLPLSGSPRLAVIGSEIQLGSGFADVLAVEDTGRLVVIEVKLARNSEARRAVVAQVLAYASYLFKTPLEELQASVLGPALSAQSVSTLAELVQNLDQAAGVDVPVFEASVRESLAEGRFRLVLVLDEVPAELCVLVAYLEAMTPQLTIDLITVTAYDVDGRRVVVPQRIEPERVTELTRAQATARDTKAREVAGSGDFEASLQGAAGEAVLRDWLAWARGVESRGLARLTTYHGANRTVLLVRLPGPGVGFVTIWNEKNSAYMSAWKSVFEKYAPVAGRKVEGILGERFGQGKSVPDVTPELLQLFTEAHEEAAAPAS